jgi:uncharacterized protein (DUF2336 family)
MSLTTQGLLAELDTTLPRATESWCSAALRRIADLFVASADNYNDEQVALFGEVIGRLIPNTGRRQLAELSNLLAPAKSAPVNVVGVLARHIDIAVCGPVLERAVALPDNDLVQIADNDRTNMNMLMKIAARPQLSEAVTDVLLKRGNRGVQRSVIDNPNALVSETGFARVIMGLNGDKELAAAIAARNDVPPELRPWLVEALAE